MSSICFYIEINFSNLHFELLEWELVVLDMASDYEVAC